MDRIQKLCSYLDKCETFADVGCDHGYCTRFMLKNNLCKSAIISDISPKCLKKAEKLLQSYITAGVCIPVCCNGLAGIDVSTEQILIAGMGGEEIVEILKSSFIPENFVFQPMRNAAELREFLLINNADITEDCVFESGGKYYFVIKGRAKGGATHYTKAQLMYGTSRNQTFKNFLSGELAKKKSYLERNMKLENAKAIKEQIKFMEEILNNDPE